MKKFFNIIKNEFKSFLKDSGATLIMIIGVVAYSFFYSLPYSTEIVKNVPMAAVDLDNSTLSREFINKLDASDYSDIVSVKLNLEEAKNEFYKNNVRAFIVIPKDFEKNIKSGSNAHISFYGDSAYLIIYKAAYSGVLQVASTIGAKIEVAKMMSQGTNVNAAIAQKAPFEYIQVPLYNPQGGYMTYVYPVILILILHQTLVVGMGLMQGSKNENGESFAPSKEEIPFYIFAKSTTYVLLYLFYSFFIFLLCPALMNYPMSYDIISLILILIPMYYGAAFFSLFVSNFFKTRETSLLVLVVTSLIFIFLPGIIWPKEAIPPLLNLVALFIPATSAVDALVKVNQIGTGFLPVIKNFLWLFVLCGFYFLLAAKNLKKNFKS